MAIPQLPPDQIAVQCEQRLCVEGCTLTYNGLLLQIVTWMESCLIGTHTTSSYIYLYTSGWSRGSVPGAETPTLFFTINAFEWGLMVGTMDENDDNTLKLFGNI